MTYCALNLLLKVDGIFPDPRKLQVNRIQLRAVLVRLVKFLYTSSYFRVYYVFWVAIVQQNLLDRFDFVVYQTW